MKDDKVSEEGCDVDLVDESGRTSIYKFLEFESPYKGAKFFIDMGIELNLRDFEGRSPLHIASLSNCPKTIRLLIENGSDIESKDDRGETPIFECIYSEKPWNSYYELAMAGADVYCKNKKGQSVIDCFIELHCEGYCDDWEGRRSDFVEFVERINSYVGCFENGDYDVIPSAFKAPCIQVYIKACRDV